MGWKSVLPLSTWFFLAIQHLLQANLSVYSSDYYIISAMCKTIQAQHMQLVFGLWNTCLDSCFVQYWVYFHGLFLHQPNRAGIIRLHMNWYSSFKACQILSSKESTEQLKIATVNKTHSNDKTFHSTLHSERPIQKNHWMQQTNC